MNALLFDTLRLSRTLRHKGHFMPEQAETLAEASGEAQHGELATKADLAVLEARLETKLESEIGKMKDDLHRCIVGAIGFQTIVVLGTLVTLVRISTK